MTRSIGLGQSGLEKEGNRGQVRYAFSHTIEINCMYLFCRTRPAAVHFLLLSTLCCGPWYSITFFSAMSGVLISRLQCGRRQCISRYSVRPSPLGGKLFMESLTCRDCSPHADGHRRQVMCVDADAFSAPALSLAVVRVSPSSALHRNPRGMATCCSF